MDLYTKITLINVIVVAWILMFDKHILDYAILNCRFKKAISAWCVITYFSIAALLVYVVVNY